MKIGKKQWRKIVNKISFIMPSRNGLKYLEWSYNSLRKNCNQSHEICMYDDFSNDGTWDWMQETLDKDPNVAIFRNDGPTRLGHTILYDKLIETATNDIVMIFHNDMYAAKNMDKEVLDILKPQTVVSVTRVEPPLHPDGPEKLVMNFGIEPEDFMEERFLRYADDKGVYNTGTTQGMFAPWAIYKEDFLAIGGHDPLYAPQSREDSDIFNRFLLAEYKPIQTWDTYVYHMTCRGSRFNPQITQVGQASPEWLAHNRKSERNFTRKWGHMVKHDSNLRPIVPHKYKINFIVKNCNPGILDALEPWCSQIFCEGLNQQQINEYTEKEQLNTMYDLSKRVFVRPNSSWYGEADIHVEFDGSKLTQELFTAFITQLPQILEPIEEPGAFEYEIFHVVVNEIKHYEKDLIIVDKTQKVR
jgi:glycosyltransferase involved in cell wall biosynthesis